MWWMCSREVEGSIVDTRATQWQRLHAGWEEVLLLPSTKTLETGNVGSHCCCAGAVVIDRQSWRCLGLLPSSRLSARRNTSLAATRAELVSLSHADVSFRKKRTYSDRPKTPARLQLSPGQQRACSADSRRSRMPVKGGGRLASYPSKGDNVGVSDIWLFSTCVASRQLTCNKFAIRSAGHCSVQVKRERRLCRGEAVEWGARSVRSVRGSQ